MPKPEVPGYELLDPIGTGASSVIFKAVEESTQDVVAVKYVESTSKDNAKVFRHLEHEHETVSMLQRSSNGSPVVARFTRARRMLRSRKLLNRRRFRALVMDYVPGQDLRKERRYPLGQLLDIYVQVLETIGYLHSRGVVHADVKPENLIVNTEGLVTLIDFGLSCAIGSKAESIRGTREYMAPEQVELGCLDGRTDLYNTAASFYYLLTDRQVATMMPNANGGEYFIGSRTLDTPPLSELNPHVPPRVARAIMQCLASDPERRPASATEALNAVRPVVAAFCHQRDIAS